MIRGCVSLIILLLYSEIKIYTLSFVYNDIKYVSYSYWIMSTLIPV